MQQDHSETTRLLGGGLLLDIVDANPGRRWVLFGDTGEKDPEVYHALMQDRPGSVYAVFIHNVTDANPQDARFAGFTVFSDCSEVKKLIPWLQLGVSDGPSKIRVTR